jgi:hypothetical protein
MLALRRLFQRKTDYLTFRAVMEQPIIDIRRYRPDCPDPLAAALARALDRDPAIRYDTARQFGSAILDAITGLRRPWTQGEISDFVRANFAQEIAQRTAQIASAVRTGSQPTAMPLIIQPDDEATEIEDDIQAFPEVSSEISQTPVDVRHLRGPSTEQPVVDEPSAQGPNLDALRATRNLPAATPPPVVVVSPKRSLVWPLVAFAMVAVAGGALLLVWRQMQNQQPTSLVITSDPGTGITRGGSNVVIVGRTPLEGNARPDDQRDTPGEGSGDVRSGSGAAPGASDIHRDTAAKAPADRRPPVNAKDRAGVDLMQPGVTRCASDHGTPPPGTRMVIAVGADGRAKRVTIVPQSVDAAPLGACIRNVVKTVTFSRGDHEFEVKLVRPA